MRFIGFLAGILLLSASVFAADPRAPTADAATNTNSSTNISTSYVELIASTADWCNALLISNTSSNPVTIALGAASSEVDYMDVADGTTVFVPWRMPKATRISAVRAGSTDLTTGFVSVSCFK